MSHPSRIFTVEEVEALLPEITARVAAQLSERQRILETLAQLVVTTGEEPPSLEPKAGDSSRVGELRQALREHIHSYEDGWHAIEQLGAVVKDPNIGLLDFYGRVDDRLVWLCWRYGEPSLGWYHELQTGFSARRALQRRELLN